MFSFLVCMFITINVDSFYFLSVATFIKNKYIVSVIYKGDVSQVRENNYRAEARNSVGRAKKAQVQKTKVVILAICTRWPHDIGIYPAIWLFFFFPPMKQIPKSVKQDKPHSSVSVKSRHINVTINDSFNF